MSVHRGLKKKWECSWAVRQLFIYIKKDYDSARTQVPYNILIEFGVPVELG